MERVLSRSTYNLRIAQILMTGDRDSREDRSRQDDVGGLAKMNSHLVCQPKEFTSSEKMSCLTNNMYIKQTIF